MRSEGTGPRVAAADRRAEARAARRVAILAVAREAFFSRGYGATSMSFIAAKVGGSKTTIWSCFRSKQEVLAALIEDLSNTGRTALEVILDADRDPAQSLRQAGRALLRRCHCERAINLHRLVLAEASRLPRIASLFHELGPARDQEMLQSLIEALMARGSVRPGDAAEAARHFAGMLLNGSAQDHLLGLAGEPDEVSLYAEVDIVVDTFMRAWRG